VDRRWDEANPQLPHSSADIDGQSDETEQPETCERFAPKKKDGRKSIERFPLNSPRELSEQGRNLLVIVTVYRQRKL
jgi:hypothetical protein